MMTNFPIPSFSSSDRSKLRTAFPAVETVFRAAHLAQVPGIAYGVVVDGELALAGGFGIQNIVDKAPVTPDSVFRIASMTKSFTAMSLMKLRDAGKLYLDAPAAEYVPELAKLRYPTRDSAPITVRNLLTMSAGLPQDDPWADRQLALTEAQLSTLMEMGLTFSNPPGFKYEYSNFGFAILGRIVTNVSGVLYQTYVKDNILKPLGMTSSTFDINDVDPKRYAMGYRREGDQWIEETPLADGSFASIGGLFTTISDFARYMACLLAAFPPRDDAETGPIRRSSLREMQQAWRTRLVTSTRSTPDAPAWVQSDSYAFGLTSGLDSLLGYTVSHGGGLPGYGTFYRLLPDCGVGVVAFSNLTYNSMGTAVNNALYALASQRRDGCACITDGFRTDGDANGDHEALRKLGRCRRDCSRDRLVLAGFSARKASPAVRRPAQKARQMFVGHAAGTRKRAARALDHEVPQREYRRFCDALANDSEQDYVSDADTRS